VENAAGAHLLNHLQGPQWSVAYGRKGADEVDYAVGRGTTRRALEIKSGRPRGASGLSAFHRHYPKAKVWLVGETGIPLAEFFSRPPQEWLAE